jgi:hypothetical protein
MAISNEDEQDDSQRELTLGFNKTVFEQDDPSVGQPFYSNGFFIAKQAISKQLRLLIRVYSSGPGTFQQNRAVPAGTHLFRWYDRPSLGLTTLKGNSTFEQRNSTRIVGFLYDFGKFVVYL